jgi:hypothetical protein
VGCGVASGGGETAVWHPTNSSSNAIVQRIGGFSIKQVDNNQLSAISNPF